MKLFASVVGLLGLATMANANSAGLGIPCDIMRPPLIALLGNAGRVKDETKSMWWTLPPVHSAEYTLKTSDTAVPGPTTYTPGQWVDLHLRAHSEQKQYTGLVMYAEDAMGNHVGNWSVNPEMPFLVNYDQYDTGCVTHKNAQPKNYVNTFKFLGPPAGTGPVTFKCMVKYGLAFPAPGSSFAYPNIADLVLQEGAAPATQWFEGEPGDDCTITCAKNGAGCDLQTMMGIQGPEELKAAVLSASPHCFEPLMSGCGPHSPTTGQEGCWYHEDECGVPPPTPAPTTRPDPCAGLPMYGGGNDWPNGACMKYTNDAGKLQKVCRTGGGGASELPGNKPQFYTFSEMCMPIGGYTNAPTPQPTPTRMSEPIQCGTAKPSILDGRRLCACAGGVQPTPLPTPFTNCEDCVPMTNPNDPGPAGPGGPGNQKPSNWRPCEDKNVDCPFWADNDECNINHEYMTKNCRKSCKICVALEDLGPAPSNFGSVQFTALSMVALFFGNMFY